MPTVTKTLGDGTQSVLLTVAIFEFLASRNGSASVTDIAREMGTSKSRVFRHLQTLVSCDYASQNTSSGHYSIGPRLVAFCRSVNEYFDLAKMAEPFMNDLRDSFGHSVIVSRVDRSGVHVLKSISGSSQIVLEVKPGTVLPLHSSAQGRVALAFSEYPSTRKRVPQLSMLGVSDEVNPAELKKIRRQGWASAQMREGLNGIAAPVFDQTGEVIGTLALLDTIARIGHEVDPAVVRALKLAAQQLSRKMGVADK